MLLSPQLVLGLSKWKGTVPHFAFALNKHRPCFREDPRPCRLWVTCCTSGLCWLLGVGCSGVIAFVPILLPSKTAESANPLLCFKPAFIECLLFSCTIPGVGGRVGENHIHKGTWSYESCLEQGEAEQKQQSVGPGSAGQRTKVGEGEEQLTAELEGRVLA